MSVDYGLLIYTIPIAAGVGLAVLVIMRTKRVLIGAGFLFLYWLTFILVLSLRLPAPRKDSESGYSELVFDILSAVGGVAFYVVAFSVLAFLFRGLIWVVFRTFRKESGVDKRS